MQYKFNVSYFACQTCTAKIHCDECEQSLVEALMRRRGINAAHLHIAKNEIHVESVLDEDDVEELLEDVSLFV